MKMDNKIVELSFNFSLQIIDLYKKLIAEREYVLSRQLLKSATSIGANIEEAIAGQSNRDFISKMSIASKEAREARYWLRLLDRSKLVDIELSGSLNSVEHIVNILTKIVKTSQQKLP